MRTLLLSILALACCSLRAADIEAPRTAGWGRVEVSKEEDLASSFLVFSKLTVARGGYDKRPLSLFQSLPIYPASALRAGVYGEATVSFVITDEGVVSDVKIESESAKDFGPASAAAILQWRFFPAEKSSRPVSVRAKARFIFSFFDENGA